MSDRRIEIVGLLMTTCLTTACGADSSGPGNVGISETEGAFQIIVHRSLIDDALPFLKSTVRAQLRDEQLETDLTEGFPLRNQFRPSIHFDGCHFVGGIDRINTMYHKVLAALDPTNTSEVDRAIDGFGTLLHTVQDFYAHSNWVEFHAFQPGPGLPPLSLPRLADSGLSLWVLPNFGNVQILQRNLPESPNTTFALAGFDFPAGRIAVVRHMGQAVGYGLISGDFALSQSFCPQRVDLSHDVLNKDAPGRPGYGNPDDPNDMGAYSLARDQTTHEWCRLVSMVHEKYGDAGVSSLRSQWVDDPVAADAACPCPGGAALRFRTLPTAQGWAYVPTLTNASESAVFSVNANGTALVQNTIRIGSNAAPHYERSDAVDPLRPFTLAVRAQVLEEEIFRDNRCGFTIGATTDVEDFVMCISAEGLEDQNGIFFTPAFDAAQVHDYRLEGIPGVGYHFFLDNVEVASGVPATLSDPPRTLIVGDESQNNAKVEITKFEYCPHR